MQVYAEEGPPTFISLAVFTGLRPKKKEAASMVTDEELMYLTSQLAGMAPPTL